MTDKKIREVIEELADNEGKTTEAYLLALVKSCNEQKTEKFKNYDEDVARQLIAADKLRNEKRIEKTRLAEQESVTKQIDEFTELFPAVSPESIPESVWKEVGDGVSLAHAYALWKQTGEIGDDPENINAKNGKRSLPMENDRSEPLDYTMQDVERMPASTVKGNYRKILNSMKKWKL